MKRIVCVGNRLAPEDAAGPAVFDRLRRRALPPGVQLLDGGVGGLGLLGALQDAEKVVLVDSVRGFGQEGEVLVLPAAEVAATARPGEVHAAGPAYLLRVLPRVCEGPVPEVVFIGVEGHAGPEAIERAAHLALNLVR